MMVPEEVSFIVSSDPSQGARSLSPDGSRFEIQFDDSLKIPKDALNVNVSVQEATIWWVSPNVITGENDMMYIFGDNDSGGSELFTIRIEQGLYDLSGLNQAIISGLEAAGAKTVDGSGNSLPLITFTADDSTQKVVLRLNYPNAYVDFQPIDTPREIMGFDAEQYGPEAAAPLNILAPNTAAFNQINHFLIHSDLVNRGIRYNNAYNQTIAQVLIDVSPGSQIVSTPYHPAKTSGRSLRGTSRTNIRFWLTDDKQRAVNTNGEYWTARVVIEYLKPYTIS